MISHTTQATVAGVSLWGFLRRIEEERTMSKQFAYKMFYNGKLTCIQNGFSNDAEAADAAQNTIDEIAHDPTWDPTKDAMTYVVVEVVTCKQCKHVGYLVDWKIRPSIVVSMYHCPKCSAPQEILP